MGVKVQVQDGKCWLRINHQGVRKSKLVGPDSKATRAEAEKAAAIIRGKLAADDLSPLAAPVVEAGPKAAPPLKHVCTEWLTWHQANFPRRESTVENYQSFIDSRLIPALGDRRISTIDRAVVQQFVAAARTVPDPQSGKVAAYTTLRSQYLPTFRKVLDYAVEKGWLAVNPFRSGSALYEPSDADREAAPKPDPFTPKEVALIIGAAQQIEPEFGLLIRTWSQLGARSGEVRGLRVPDLNLKAGTARIERALKEQDGKAVLGPVKNLRGKRLASLRDAIATDQAPEALLARLAKHVQGKAADAFVFEKPSGGPVTFGSLKERWTRALDLAGVRYREPEQMRHSYVSVMLSRGENPLKVAKQTGHTVAVMLSSYAEFVEQPDATPRKPAASRRRNVA